MTRAILSPAAQSDLESIRDYLVQRAGRRTAARVVRKLHEALNTIGSTPGIGHLRTDLSAEPVRFYRVFRYLIIYRANVHPIEVARILHGARNIRAILRED